MPFGSYQTYSDVAKAYRVMSLEERFVTPRELSAISSALREDLDFAFAQGKGSRSTSDFARCETFIYPILKEVWKHYATELTLWSHEPINFDADLRGTPDYYLARRSPLGPPVMEEPYLMVMEAKRDDFDLGWAQCLAAMLATQKLNPTP